MATHGLYGYGWLMEQGLGEAHLLYDTRDGESMRRAYVKHEVVLM